MESDEYAELAIMMNLGHWAFSQHLGSVDFDTERDAIIRQLREGLQRLIATLKEELPGAAVWMCTEACVRFDRCGSCHRTDHPMFSIYYEKHRLDEWEMQRIRGEIMSLVRRLLPLSEEQEQAVAADIAQTRMIRIGNHDAAAGAG